MSKLAESLAHRPATVLQAVVDAGLQFWPAASIGISLLASQEDVFRWVAISGPFAPNADGTLPKDASPCGMVIAKGTLLLFDRPHRFFDGLRSFEPPIYQALLAPWHSDDGVAGTIWAISHGDDQPFDGEDARLLSDLAHFSSAAWRLSEVMEENRRRRESNERLLALNAQLENLVAEVPDDIAVGTRAAVLRAIAAALTKELHSVAASLRPKR